MLIKKGGVYRQATPDKFEKNYKKLGYEVVEKEEKEVDIKDYHTGRGWYEYEGKKYRKDELAKVLDGAT